MKRVRLIVIVVAVIVFGGLAFAIFRAREPRYQGRTLSEWIGDGRAALEKFTENPKNDPLPVESDPDWQSASHAVKQIGQDAIPYLLKWVETKDSAAKMLLIHWSEDHPSLRLDIKAAEYYHESASMGFEMLGAEAKPAWGGLIKMTYAPDIARRRCAFDCLMESRPDKETLLPVLLRLIHDPDPILKSRAARRFRHLYPQDAESAGVSKILSGLKKLQPNSPSTNQPQVK